MAGVTHYESLGIAPDASPEDVRRAYLRLAREHHPDRHAGSSSRSGVADAERRMREVNAAWAVLGDAGRRADYDRRTLNPPDGPGATGAAGPVRHQPSTEFTPYHDEDEDDDDSWRYEPDEFDPATSVGRVLGAGPPLLLLGGMALLGVSLVVGFAPLTALGLACVVFAVLMFIGAPMVAVFKSQIHEDRRRGGPGPTR
jgi:hypothetical protein